MLPRGPFRVKLRGIHQITPRHSNDNGLAETKNGAIVRKHLGYSHIPQHYASEVNAFCQEFLNPYVNFQRPCFFALSFTDDKGKIRKRYTQANMMTPYEKLSHYPAPRTSSSRQSPLPSWTQSPTRSAIMRLLNA